VFYKGWTTVQWFGFLVPINLVYDLNLCAIL